MVMKKEKNTINKKDVVINSICFIGAIIFTLFIWHKFLASGNSVIFLALLYPIFLVLKNTMEDMDKRKIKIIGITSGIFSIIEVMCSSINIDYTLNSAFDKWLLINLIGYFTISWIIMNLLFKIYGFIENSKTDKKG